MNDLRLHDKVVVYRSEEDGGIWIAHSLRTDQIGTGDRPVDALADLIVAVRQVLKVAGEDPSVAVYREAPVEIQRLHDAAVALPAEIYEVAHKMATGHWPQDWVAPQPIRDQVVFAADIEEVGV